MSAAFLKGIMALLVGAIGTQVHGQSGWEDAGMPYPSFGVSQLYVDPVNDERLACGFISLVNDYGFVSIASFDGATWNSFGVFNGTVKTCIRYGDSLLVGGAFPSINGDPVSFIGAWYDSAWHTFGSFSPDCVIRSLTIVNGELYALGAFETADGHSCHGVAKRQGGEWVNLGSINYAVGNEPQVLCIAEYQGNIVVGGEMNPIGMGSDILQYDGTQWSDLGGGILGGFSAVGAMQVYSGELYVGGDIYVGAGNAGHGLMRWNGSIWNDVGGSMRDVYGTTNYNGAVVAMLEHDGKLLVGGGFGFAGDIEAGQFAIWDGLRWCAPYDSIGDLVRTMTYYHDTLYLNCGNDLNLGTSNFVARWVGGAFEDTCGIAMAVDEFAINAPGQLSTWLGADGNLSIHYDGVLPMSATQVVLLDMQGRTVLRSPFTEGQTVSINHLSSGIYLVQLNDERGMPIEQGRFMKP